MAILAGNRAEFLVAYFGTMRAGLVSVPVNHKFSRETIDFVMRDSGAKLVFCDGERRAQASARRWISPWEYSRGRSQSRQSISAVAPAGRDRSSKSPRLTGWVIRTAEYTPLGWGRSEGRPARAEGA